MRRPWRLGVERKADPQQCSSGNLPSSKDAEQLQGDGVRYLCMSPKSFYREQAERCAAEARSATLPMQREQWLAAEKAWRNLADRPGSVAANWH